MYSLYAQAVIKGYLAFWRCQRETLGLVKRVQAKGPVRDDDVSAAAQLLRIRYAISRDGHMGTQRMLVCCQQMHLVVFGTLCHMTSTQAATHGYDVCLLLLLPS
jgi:hypothetical protein